ncbi:MAG: recombinase RecA [candidate division SR1 bacterium]|nr:recombinase RecA [candidate division SR1 bacterium]
MAFTKEEREELLAIKGVGNIFINRLEEMGFGSVEKLKNTSIEQIVTRGAEITGSSCYKNSPQAKNAAQNAILRAQHKSKK